VVRCGWWLVMAAPGSLPGGCDRAIFACRFCFVRHGKARAGWGLHIAVGGGGGGGQKNFWGGKTPKTPPFFFFPPRPGGGGPQGTVFVGVLVVTGILSLRDLVAGPSPPLFHRRTANLMLLKLALFACDSGPRPPASLGGLVPGSNVHPYRRPLALCTALRLSVDHRGDDRAS